MQPQTPVPPNIVTRLDQLECPPVVDAHPYESIDPFTASISLRIRNNQRRNTISNVDEIGPPLPPPVQHPLSHHPSRSTMRSNQAMSPTPARLSLESGRSAPATTPYSPLAKIPESHRAASPQEVSHPPATPRRRNALDTTIMALEEPTENFEATTSQTAPDWHIPNENSQPEPEPGSLWNPITSVAETRSTASSVHHHHHLPDQRARYATFSEAFLPTHLNEKIVRPNIYNSPTVAQDSEIPLRVYLWIFLTGILPRQIYLHCLLRLPYMYFSRVDQIFVDAQLSLEEIKELALQDSVNGLVHRRKSTRMPRAYKRLKHNWEQFIDNLMREWKTLNIISGLLLSGILTIFQIEGVNSDPLTRSASLCSLNCALLSLLYGCFFIIRFSGMRRVYRAAEWAIEAQHDHNMFWNVWVMLAMPAIWLVWSILAYVAAVMSFMWRIRPGAAIAQIPPREEFALRVLICLIFAIGVVYALLIINTLRRYGSNMDKAWKHRIEGFRGSQPRKTSKDEPPSSHDDRSPWVDVVPPTPRAHTPLSYFSETFEQPQTTPQIPPSFTRRAEVSETTTIHSTRPDHMQPSPSIFTTIYSSPKSISVEISASAPDEISIPMPLGESQETKPSEPPTYGEIPPTLITGEGGIPIQQIRCDLCSATQASKHVQIDSSKTQDTSERGGGSDPICQHGSSEAKKG